MLKVKYKRYGIILALSVGGLAFSACSTQNIASRYGDANNGCCVETTTCVEMVDCGYWVTPIHHIQTREVVVEKDVIVEKEVIKQLPPVTVYEPAPCPADTTPDSNGACIRTVTVEVPVPPSCPEGTIPGYGGQGCIPIVIHRK